MSGYEQRPGDYRFICAYSGMQGWASESALTWNGHRVLRRFLGEEGQRHPQDLVRAKPERQVPQWTRPEPTDTFLGVNDVTPSSL